MEFSTQEYWSGLPFPSPGDLPDPSIKYGSSALQADFLLSEPPGKPKDKEEIHTIAKKKINLTSETQESWPFISGPQALV